MKKKVTLEFESIADNETIVNLFEGIIKDNFRNPEAVIIEDLKNQKGVSER